MANISHVKFASLPVVDQDRAIAFYTRHLGMALLVDSPYGEDWRWVELEVPGARTKILLTQRGTEPPPAHPVMILIVADVNLAHYELSNAGVVFDLAPEPAPWDLRESYALFRDSEDNLIQLSDG